MLDGHGPIPASMARDLVANGAGSFYRVLVDPRDGAPLEIGRTSYRVGTAMRNWLRMRDGKCPFPGCSNHSLDNEADHILAWHQGGTTGISNLGQPCPKHHKLRHTSGWKPTPATKNEPPGWISPSGRRYNSEHQDREPPHWPEKILEQLDLHQLGGVLHASREKCPDQQLPPHPLPEWVWQHQPIHEPDPDPYEYPHDYWPLAEGQLPDQSLWDQLPDWVLRLSSERILKVEAPYLRVALEAARAAASMAAQCAAHFSGLREVRLGFPGRCFTRPMKLVPVVARGRRRSHPVHPAWPRNCGGAVRHLGTIWYPRQPHA
jgi:hypothetical protein